MRRMMTFISIAVAIIVIGAVALTLFARITQWQPVAGDPDQGPLALTAVERSGKPNDAYLCTVDLCVAEQTDGVLPAYDASPDSVATRIETAMRDLANATRVDDGTDPMKLRFVTHTPTLRFPDTTWFELEPLDEGRTGIRAFARAQLGHSDAGNNRKRLVMVTEAVKSAE